MNTIRVTISNRMNWPEYLVFSSRVTTLFSPIARSTS